MTKSRTLDRSDGGLAAPVLPSQPSVTTQPHQLFDQEFPKSRVVYSSKTGEVYCESPFPGISKISYQHGKFSVSVGLSPELESGDEDWSAYAQALGEKIQLVSGLNALLLQEGFNFSAEKMGQLLVTFQKNISPHDLEQALSTLCGTLREYTQHLATSGAEDVSSSRVSPSTLRGDESLEELGGLLKLQQQATLNRFEYLLARRGYRAAEPGLRGHNLVGNYVCATDNPDQEHQIYIRFFGTGDLERLKKMATGELESVPEVNLSIWDRSGGFSLHKEGLSHREVFPEEASPTLADIGAFFSGSELDDKFAWAILKPKITGEGQNLPAISR